MARHDSVAMPHSKLKASILNVIQEAGFIKDVAVVGEGARKQLVATLKYTSQREPIILGLRRVSRPGLRIYRGFKELGDLKPGMGAAVLATPKGVMTDAKAFEAKVGGEVLLQVW